MVFLSILLKLSILMEKLHDLLRYQILCSEISVIHDTSESTASDNVDVTNEITSTTPVPPVITKTAHMQGIAFRKEFNANTPVQPRLSNYPVTVFGKERGLFHSSWYSVFPWLEYCVDTDLCFCFACRVFIQDGKYEPGFTKNGIRNWHNAMEKGHGHYAHNECTAYKCDEKIGREKEGSSVD